jgi:hypothetical protein
MTSSFSSRFKDLIRMLDIEDTLTHKTRINMYRELIEAVSSDEVLNILKPDILQSLHLYCNELKEANNYDIIHILEHEFSEFMHIPPRTIFYNPQNVHYFMTPATYAAKEIMEKFPCKYVRPSNEIFDDSFLNVIETNELVNGIHMPSLFASVWFYIKNHKERINLTNRLIEEMNDCNDMCLSGHMIRLVNSVKGFDDVFEFNLEEYEYNKAFIFNQFNKLLGFIDPDNLLDQMEKVILNTGDIKNEDVIKILRDYSKHEWCIRDGKFQYIR